MSTRLKVNKNSVCCITVLICTLLLTSTLKAATLTIGSASGSPGKSISIPINLTSASGEKVCGFNFDLNYDAAKLSFKEVTLGYVAMDAGKSLSFSQPSSNTIRVVVVGLNQNVIGNGEVLNFTFDILRNAPVGKTELTITKASISDLNGKALRVDIESGVLEVLR
jgi:hypothetical protein